MSGGGPAEAPKMPGYAKEALKPYAGQLQDFGQNYDPQFFGGQTYAGQDPYTSQGIQGLGNLDTGMSQDYMQNTLQGDYLGLNPAMSAAVMDPAMDASAGRFNMMGRYGSPASQTGMMKAGMQAAMPYYNQERGRQQQAAMMLPGLQQQQAQSQLMAGGMNEAWGQKDIDEQMARWNFEQNQPYDIMQKWSSLYGPIATAGMVGGSPAEGSPLAGAAGGALMGGAAGGAMAGTEAGAFLGPYGMMAGAALGGLAGYYGTQ
jgi:hypothetical protein